MSTESLKYARFDHPKHGNYESPEAVANDSRLSEGEKRMILEEWRSSLAHILNNDPDAPEVRKTSESLDITIERLAAAKTS